MIMHEEDKSFEYMTVDELSDYLQLNGYSTSKPSLIKQQMYGVMMRSLPETELYEWGRDTRKRLYHPFSVYENITASKLFSGLYWRYNIHGARMVHFDVFIGRLGYYADNFKSINAKYGIEKQRINKTNTFAFSVNDVFRKLLQESGVFKITEIPNKDRNKVELIERRYTRLNSGYDENLLASFYRGYESFTDLFFLDNAVRMNEKEVADIYKYLVTAACQQLLNSRIDAECYMAYQKMMYTRTMEEVIGTYEESLIYYINKKIIM